MMALHRSQIDRLNLQIEFLKEELRKETSSRLKLLDSSEKVLKLNMKIKDQNSSLNNKIDDCIKWIDEAYKSSNGLYEYSLKVNAYNNIILRDINILQSKLDYYRSNFIKEHSLRKTLEKHSSE